MTRISSGKIIAKNTLINLVGQVLPLLVGIVTIPMLIKGLGTDRFGVLTLAWMVIGYFSLFDLGLGRALTQIIAKSLGKEEELELPGLVWTALTIMLVMGAIGGGIAGILSPHLVDNIFKMPAQLRPETLHAFFILSASIPVVVISSGLVGILTAYQRFDLINVVRIPLGLTNFLVPLLVLPFSNSLVPITLMLAVTRVASCVAQYVLCLHLMPSLRMNKRFISGAVKPLFSFGGWMTVSNIIGPLMVYLDRFVIGTVISVTAVAYYATPYEMVTKLWIVSGALISSLFPAFAACNNSDAVHSTQLLSKSIAATFILIFPIVLAIVTFSQEGLMFWLGKDFANNGATVLQWLAAGVFLNCLAQVIYTLIQGQGRPDLTAKIHLLEFAFYLPLLFWILIKYGITGAAIAWTLRVAVDAVLLMWAAQRMNHFKSKLLVKMSGYSIVPSMALALCGCPDSIAVRSFLFVCTGLCFLIFSISFIRRNGLLGFYH